MTVYPNELLDMDRVALLQAVILVVGFGMAWALGRHLPALGSWRSWGKLPAARPWVPPLAAGVMVFLGSALVSTTVRWPVPSVHDEFGYLLIADTFAHGRLTNPSPEHWEHFEAIHLLMQPTYQSKYPPGTGAMITLGKLVSGGQAAVGLWLGVALLCAATTWMLQGIVEQRWALAAGMLMAMHYGLFGYWSQTYWGGSVAMLGGALMLGATMRLARHGPSAAQSLVLGAGLFLLSFSRPFEGFVASLPVGVWLLWMLWKWFQEDDSRAGAVRVLAVQVVSAMAILVAHGTYNQALTGSATTMPYREYQRQYAEVPEFLFSGPMEPERRPPRFRRIHGELQERFEERSNVVGFLQNQMPRIALSWLWLCSIPLVVPFVVGVGLIRRVPAGPIVLTSFGLALAACSMTLGVWPHYYAPVGPVFLIGATLGLRALWRRGAGGRGVVLGAWLAMAGTVVAGFVPGMRNTDPVYGLIRQAHIDSIKRIPGDHLVLVEYTPDFTPHCEWVFNGADLDGSRVIWATSLGEERDAELIAAYQDRSVWVFDADAWWWRVMPQAGDRELSGASHANGP